MYAEYPRVKKLLDNANLLLQTSMTMKDIFDISTINNRKNIAVEFVGVNGKLKHYKYSKLRKNSFQYASTISNILKAKKQNQVVVLKMANSPKWIESFWGILMSGFKPLLIDAKTSLEGTNNLIKQSKAIAIITDDHNKYEVDKITPEELTNKNSASGFEPNWENEVIFCSSGTTGDVKLMVFNGENLCHQIMASLEMAETTKDIMYPKKYGKIKILTMIPLHHIFGFVAVFLWYTYYGKTLVFPQSISHTEIQQLCQKTHVTHVYSVPLFWDSMAQAIERKQELETPEKKALFEKVIAYNTKKISKEEAGQASSKIVKDYIQKNLLGNDIRYCISGGGYLSNKTLTIINGIGYPLYNGFGMTELGVTSVELSPNVTDRLLGSIGKPLYNVSYKLKSIDDKKNSGELLVKSPITHIREIIGGVEKETITDKEGYYPTGDIAEIDENNNYFIKGRIKDIIINADGENIFPDEIEIFFKKIPNIVNLCVLGVKQNKSTNEDVVLVIETSNTCKEEDIKTIKEQILEIGKKLPKGTKINRIFLSKDKLPVANNMKIKRFMVKKDIENNSPLYISIDAKKETKEIKEFSKEEIEKVIVPMRELFSEILILPSFKIDDNAHWVNDLGGDSMNYVELVQKLQTKFDVTIAEDKYGQLTCVNDFTEEVLKLKKM